MSVTTVWWRSNSWSIMDFQMDFQILVTLRVSRQYDRGPIGGRLLIFKWTSKCLYHYECDYGTTEVQLVVDYGFSNGPPNTSNTTSVTTVWQRSNSWSIIDFQMDLRVQPTVQVSRQYDGGPIGGSLLIFKWTSKYKYQCECDYGTTEVQLVVDYRFLNGPPNTSTTSSTTRSVTTVRPRSNLWSIIDFQMTSKC
jgi:hypothetical protein